MSAEQGDPPLLFAHRGARAHAPENTMTAFRLAIEMGASGLESDVWITADGVAVLDHDGVVGRFPRRVIARTVAAELPERLPTLGALLAELPADTHLSLDVKAVDAFAEVARQVASAGATGRTWLCHPDLAVLESWREADPDSLLVHSSSPAVLATGLERHAARLRAGGVDCLNLRESHWKGGDVVLLHRFGRRAFGWDAHHPRTIRRLLAMGIDGVFGDHVDRMIATAAEFG